MLKIEVDFLFGVLSTSKLVSIFNISVLSQIQTQQWLRLFGRQCLSVGYVLKLYFKMNPLRLTLQIELTYAKLLNHVIKLFGNFPTK